MHKLLIFSNLCINFRGLSTSTTHLPNNFAFLHNNSFNSGAPFLHFPLFQSHIDLAHSYWKRLLQDGDWAIDATCGAGFDTLKLAEFGAGVIGIDIQEEAIRRTEELLKSSLSAEAFLR